MNCMFEQAFKRLFVVLLPLFFIALAFFIISMESKKQMGLFTRVQPEECQLLLGVSPFSKKKPKTENSKKEATDLSRFSVSSSSLGESYFLTKEELLKSLKAVENILQEKTFFVWPLVLNKDEEWILSEKVFFILPTGERKEISHLTYEEILYSQNLDLQTKNTQKHELRSNKRKQNQKRENKEKQNQKRENKKKQNQKRENKEKQNQKRENKEKQNQKRENKEKQSRKKENKKSQKNTNKIQIINSNQDVLTLNTALSYMPKNSHFLFFLLGSDRQKIIKNLDKALLQTRGAVYISSDNERLLDELYQHSFQSDFKILHSYKSLIRLEMISAVSHSFYERFKGDGLIVPDLFSPISFDTLVFLKQQRKLLFFEKDPPYKKEDKKWIENSAAVISSQIQETLSYLHQETKCSF